MHEKDVYDNINTEIICAPTYGEKEKLKLNLINCVNKGPHL